MKALSIQQPWAYLICAGIKDVENRTWQTSFRGEFYIHASKTIDKESFMELKKRRLLVGIELKDLQIGGIIGQAKLIDCCKGYLSKWAIPGQNHFVVDEAKFIDFIPLRGQLNFFEANV